MEDFKGETMLCLFKIFAGAELRLFELIAKQGTSFRRPGIMKMSTAWAGNYCPMKDSYRL